MVTDQRVNAATFIDFLRRLLVNAERPIYLVLDGHPVHRSKKVRDFVEAQDGQAQAVFLAALFAGAEPGRTGLERHQGPSCRSHRRRG